MQNTIEMQSGWRGVSRKVWIAAAATVFAFAASAALSIDRASREANRYTLEVERRLVEHELALQGDIALKKLQEIAWWNESVEALAHLQGPNLSFVREYITDWMTQDLGFHWAAVITADGKAILSRDGELLGDMLQAPEITGNADILALARERFEAKARSRRQGRFVATDRAGALPRIDAQGFRIIDGYAMFVIAQAVVAETEEFAVPAERQAYLIAGFSLDKAWLGPIGKRLVLGDPRIEPVDNRSDVSVPLDPGAGPAKLRFAWTPREPRMAILAQTAPFAAALCAMFALALGYIVRGHARAVRELAESERQNRFMASHDMLTGLANRVYFDRQLAEEFSRLGGDFAVLCIDLDKFKAVNDTHGHQAGDEVLRVVAGRFGECVGPKGLVARIGGDEFIALVRGFESRDDLKWLADRLIEEASQPVAWNGEQLCIGASVGIAVALSDGQSPAQIVKAADAALYASKAGGRGRASLANAA
jgi:diguanylate cyclase (GGDEF)-like protein